MTTYCVAVRRPGGAVEIYHLSHPGGLVEAWRYLFMNMPDCTVLVAQRGCVTLRDALR